MAIFEVYFFGLICHVGDKPDTKSRAVIIDAISTQHVPLIVINGVPHRLRKGDNISFGLPSGDVDTHADFNKYLPSLRDLILGEDDIREEIKSGTGDADVISYVHYPRGELAVADLFPESAYYDFSGGASGRDDECVARLTYVQASTAETQLDVRYGNSVETVTANSWVLISNSSPANSDGHFFEYLRLTKGSDIASAHKGAKNCALSTTARYVNDVKHYLKIQNAKSFDAASIARAEARSKSSPPSLAVESNATPTITKEKVQTEATDIECSNTRFP